jgi:CRP-like cAMP-binding protein
MTKVAPNAVLHRLAEIPLFERCDRRQLAQIANLGTAVTVRDGTELVTEHQPARQFIVLTAGRARCTLDQCQVGELGVGALIGAASAIYGGPSPLTVVTQGPAELIVYDTREVLALMEVSDAVAAQMLSGNQGRAAPERQLALIA